MEHGHSVPADNKGIEVLQGDGGVVDSGLNIVAPLVEEEIEVLPIEKGDAKNHQILSKHEDQDDNNIEVLPGTRAVSGVELLDKVRVVLIQ